MAGSDRVHFVTIRSNPDHRGLSDRAEAIPDEVRQVRQREAIARLITLYEAWGKPEEAKVWRRRLPGAGGEEDAMTILDDVFARPGEGR